MTERDADFDDPPRPSRIDHLFPKRECVHGVPLGVHHTCMACAARAVGYVNPKATAIVALRRIVDVCIRDKTDDPGFDRILNIASKALHSMEEL